LQAQLSTQERTLHLTAEELSSSQQQLASRRVSVLVTGTANPYNLAFCAQSSVLRFRML
jgi:hypothetical protein